jgi:Flp pilus assembly protein TadG
LTYCRFDTFRREDGQVLIFSVLVLAALLGIAGLVIDGGNTLLQRRNQQGVADAAAMAAVKDLPLSTVAADTTARDYATTRNSADASTIDQVVVTGALTGACDGGMGTIALAKDSVCVVLHTHTNGTFSSILGISNWNENARAVAQASQVTGLGGWLPFGARKGAYTESPPTQITITPGAGSDNVSGMINSPAGPTCKSYGGANITDVIEGAAHGGADACPISIGQTIPTQTGNLQGPITHGFDARIGSNTDSFSDVFGKDASGNYYVKNASSPRLGIMPLAQDATGNWPLTGGADIPVVGYVLVYIGNTLDLTPPLYEAYSGSGPNLKIYLTPVNVPLPDDWAAQIGDYNPSNPSPIVYHLVQ